MTTCWVCSEQEADAQLLSMCDSCGQDFHLNPRQTPGKDCGDVSLSDEDDPVLQFFCQPCLDGTTGQLLEQRAGA